MVARGLYYAFSPEKTAFDANVAKALESLALLSRLALQRSLRGHPEEKEGLIYREIRGGANGVPFTAYKLRTLDHNGEPLNETAQRLRRYGFDELAQIRNIKKGEMGVAGRRPLAPPIQEAVLDYATPRLVDQWNKWALPTLPALFGSFSIRHHQHRLDPLRPEETIAPFADEVLESDLHDVQKGSRVHDTYLAGQVLSAMIRGEL